MAEGRDGPYFFSFILASLRQSNQAPARGTRRWHHRRCNQL